MSNPCSSSGKKKKKNNNYFLKHEVEPKKFLFSLLCTIAIELMDMDRSVILPLTQSVALRSRSIVVIAIVRYTFPFYRSIVMSFHHFAILSYYYSADLPFIHSIILPFRHSIVFMFRPTSILHPSNIRLTFILLMSDNCPMSVWHSTDFFPTFGQLPVDLCPSLFIPVDTPYFFKPYILLELCS